MKRETGVPVMERLLKPFLDQQYNWTAVFSDMPLQKDS